MVAVSILLGLDVLVVALHEAGHVAVARLFGVRLTGFTFGIRRGFGVRLGRDDLILRRRERALIAAGGPAASLLLMLVAGRAGLLVLAGDSLLLLLVNLIPARHSDGRKIWREMRGV